MWRTYHTRRREMSSLPVLRLSQALYTNVPTARGGDRKPLPISRRKRALEPSSSTQTTSTDACYSAVRVLLPRSFAVADRAYHAAAGGRVPGDGLGYQKEEAELTCPCHLDTPLLGYDISLENGCSVETQSNYGANGDNAGGAEALNDTDDSNNLERKDCGLAQHTAAVRERSRQESVFVTASAAVVVESVLGFLAVRALLEQAHRDSAGKESKRDSSRQAASAAVQRLVGWLRFSLLTAALLDGNEESALSDLWLLDAVAGCPQVACSRGTERTTATAGPRRRRHEGRRVGLANGENEEELGPSSLAKDVDAYEVTGRCEAGMEWSVFYLELEDATDDQGRPLARVRKTSGGAPERWDVLEVKLICHPLVTMAPDIRWCLRLIGQAKAIASLLNANAKLSTLGGGYFLTRQVGQAIHLARAQAQVATALGNLQLARKCRINEAYNYIWLGEYAQARTIIHAQLAAARAVHDEELETIAAIAAKFLTRAKKANHRLLGTEASGAAGDSNHAFRADGTVVGRRGWARPQIDVKTDEWHRVRALPLYCSTVLPSGSTVVYMQQWTGPGTG